MSFTFCVLKLSKSRLVRFEQPRNISLMCVTFAVLKLLKSTVARLVQFSNI